MYAELIGIITNDSHRPIILPKLKLSQSDSSVDEQWQKNNSLKKEYENLKRQLENLTKDHLSFFETFKGNFKKQEQSIKEISELSNKLEDEIVLIKSRILEKQKKIQILQTQLATQQISLEYRGRQISTNKNYSLSWQLLLFLLLCTFLLISYQKLSERIVY